MNEAEAVHKRIERIRSLADSFCGEYTAEQSQELARLGLELAECQDLHVVLEVATRKTLTKNDERVLLAVQRACEEWDGFAPHGSADWSAIRRLVAAGLVREDGEGICQDCHHEEHLGPVFVLAKKDKGDGSHHG